MYRNIHAMGCSLNQEDCDNEAPVMDTLVALRLAIALMHGRKQQPMLVKNRFVATFFFGSENCIYSAFVVFAEL